MSEQTVQQAIHDLRSPLSVLKILLRKLEHSPEAYSPALAAAVFARIEHISEELMQQTPKVRKIESLPQAIHAVLTEKTIECGPRVRFASSVAADAVYLSVDTFQIMRLLSNLINNAVQAGGSYIEIEVRRENGFVHLSVSDDGQGFAEDVLADLKSGIAHLVAKPGHGFGLRHASQLASALNGKLFLRSLPMQGSCVTLALPLNQEGVEV